MAAILIFLSLVVIVSGNVEDSQSDDVSFKREYIGGLPLGLSRAVPNSLKLVELDGRIVLEGETSAPQQYQIVSTPMTVKEGTVLISLALEGKIQAGGIYYAFLDQKGSWCSPVMYSGVGEISSGESVIRPPVGPVTIVLGNGGSGPSRWQISAIRFVQMTEQDRLGYVHRYAQKTSFQGSGWWWALEVLRGRIRPDR